MSSYEFETHEPVDLYVELGKGDIIVTATDTTATTVEVEGREPERVEVRQDGRQVSVIGPKSNRGLFGGEPQYVVTISLPTRSNAVVKTGSGDLEIGYASEGVSMSTGSGDMRIRHASKGKVTAKGASGDVLVGIPAGTPVWTDLTTVSGDISSDLHGAGQPEPGADYVELRAKTVSGDIHLTEV